MASLTACLIVKNEEKWIRGCLQNLKKFVDEIVVIDTGSTDKTMAICRDEGVILDQMEWEDDFAKARNKSLDHATKDWVFIIDPDERIAERDMAPLRSLMDKEGVEAYSFNARNYAENAVVSGFCPCMGEYDEEKDYIGYFESRKTRLFRNKPTTRFVGSVHELVESTIKGKVVASEIPIHHYGSSQEVMKEKGKTALYRKHAKKKAEENPMDWKAQFEEGIEWLSTRDFEKAAISLKKADGLKPKDPLILSNLGFALMESGVHDEAEKVLTECCEVDPQHHDALLNIGVVRMRQANWDGALEIFDRLVNIHPRSFLAFRNAGNCYAQKRDFKNAARHLEQALKLFPAYVDAKIDLGIVCYAGGRPDVAKKILEECLQENPQSLRSRAILDEIQQKGLA